MADHVTITQTGATSIATDDVGGIHYQRVKLALGADGVAADLPGDATDGAYVQVRKVPRPSTSAVTSATAATTAVTLLAANAARHGATVFNDSAATLYLKLGASPSTTSYTVQVPAGGYYEVPFGFTGTLTGVWSSATGAARVTELT